MSRRFCKTVIRSVAALTYMEAQILIDDKSRTDPLSEGLRGLNELAKKLKQRRIEAGALTLASPEVCGTNIYNMSQFKTNILVLL